MKLKYFIEDRRVYLVTEDGDSLCHVVVPGHISAETTAKDIVRMYNKGLTVAKDDLTEMQEQALKVLQGALELAKVHGLLELLKGAYTSPVDVLTFCAGVKEMFEANGSPT